MGHAMAGPGAPPLQKCKSAPPLIANYSSACRRTSQSSSRSFFGQRTPLLRRRFAIGSRSLRRTLSRARSGEVFRQVEWTDAKATMLKSFAAKDYAAATIASSKATIDPDAHSAVLEVTLESGPAFRFGETHVTGLELYRPEIVLNLNTITPGEPFAQQELDQLQRRLSATGYFASVQTGIDIDPARAAATPITIAVIEAPPRRLELGGGYSTDTTYNLTFRYSDVNANGNGLQWVTNVRIAGNTQTGSLLFNLPPRAE